MRIGTEVLAAAAALSLGLVAAASGAPTLSGPGTVRVTDKLVSHLHVNASNSRSSAGDMDFYRQAIYNKRVTPSPIGHSDVTCVHTGTGSMNCTGTYFLPKGKIMVGGVIGSRLFYQLAVIGGTGIYDNARGTLTATFLGGDPPEEFLLFRLNI